MSREAPGPGCVELAFAAVQRIPSEAETVVEDYARTLTRARAAAILPGGAEGEVRGVHLCEPGSVTDAVRADLEAFARDLAARAPERLGWS